MSTFSEIGQNLRIQQIKTFTLRLAAKRSAQATFVVALMTIAFVAPMLPKAFAVTDVGNAGVFELDGNIAKESAGTFPTDWAALFTSTGTALPLPPGGIDSAFVNDALTTANPVDNTIYTTGSKDINNISGGGWQCTSKSNLTPKDKILDIYSFAIVPTFGPRAGHLLIYAGYERFSNAGAGDIGIWLLQDPNVNCTAPTTTTSFSGTHTVNDLLFTAEFTTGGSVTTLNAFNWTGTALNTTPIVTSNDCTAAPSTANFCARSNAAPITNVPWPVQDKTSAAGTLATAEFFEVGIDLTGFLGANAPCINRFLFDSRASPSPTADLHDFAIGSLSTCPKAHITTNASPTPIALGSSSSDTATVTLTNSNAMVAGTVDFKVFGPSSTNTPTCTGTPAASFTGKTISGTGSATANSGLFTPTLPGYYFWTATYNPTGPRNGNTVSTSCGDAGETLVVVSSQITTSATNPVTLGMTATDVATVTLTPSSQPVLGTVDFTVYGPVPTNTPMCTTVAGTFTGVAISGAGTGATAQASFTATQAGYYFWKAKYNPQTPANGPVAASNCGDTGETTKVISSAITSAVSVSMITFGGSVMDKATVTLNPSDSIVAGTVDFTVFGPNNPTCSGTPVASFPGNVIGPGPSPQSVTSPSFTPPATGTYRWVAVYNPAGTANGNTATGICGDSTETAVVLTIPKITGFGFTNTPTNNDPTLGSGTVTYTFTVHNFGTSPVSLTGTLVVSGSATVSCTGGNTLNISGSVAGGSDSAPITLTCTYSGSSNQNVMAVLNVSFIDANNDTGAVSGSPTTYIFTIQQK